MFHSGLDSENILLVLLILIRFKYINPLTNTKINALFLVHLSKVAPEVVWKTVQAVKRKTPVFFHGLEICSA